MHTSRHALIIGGGIAGPVTAMFLQKAGISSAIYEARPSAENASGGLQIAPNGMNVFKALGIDDKVAAAGCIASYFCFRNSEGKTLSKVATGLPEIHGSTAVTITRSALHKVLIAEATERGIPITYNKSLAKIDDMPGQQLVAHFEDGSSAEGDILIGADGIWSATRRLIMPEAPAPVYTGLIGIGGFAPLTNSPGMVLSDPKTMTMTWGPRGFFGYGQCRVPRDQGTERAMLWWSNQPQDIPPTREELKSSSQEDLRHDLLQTHLDWHDPIEPLIENTQEVMRTAIYEMPSLPTWHKNRTVLIGDAAHAMATSAGQGASQALEDAMLLAKLLRDEQGVMQNSFHAFETQRRPRVEKISAIARRNSDRKKALGPFALRVRDFLIAHMMPILAKHSWNAMYSYKIDW